MKKQRRVNGIEVTVVGADEIVTPYFSIRQAARYLTVSPWTVKRLLGTRKLQPYKVGSRTVVKIVDVEALVQKAG